MLRLQEDHLQEKINNLPTRFDLYGLENQCRELVRAINGTSDNSQTLSHRIDTLSDNVEELCKSIDALTKMKLPQLLAKDQE